MANLPIDRTQSTGAAAKLAAAPVLLSFGGGGEGVESGIDVLTLVAMARLSQESRLPAAPPEPRNVGEKQVEKKAQQNKSSQGEDAIGKEACQALGHLFNLLDVPVERCRRFIGPSVLPYILKIHVFDQRIQGDAKVIAQQDQSLEIRVGLAGIT